MKYFYIFLFSILVFGSCLLSTDDCFEEFIFTIPNLIRPSIDTFQLGDTIWFKSSIPLELDEKDSGVSYNLDQIDFPIALLISRLDTEGFVYARDQFSYFNIVGAINTSQSITPNSALLKYDLLDNGERICEFGIICNTVGDFELGTANLTSDFENVDVSSSDCIQDVILHYSMNGDTSSNNYYLLNDRLRPVATEDAFKQDGGYAFVVVE